MRIVGYCRVSTDNQKEEGTIEIQRIALEEYARENGLELVQVFQDEGISGSKDMDNRPGLASLFDYLEEHKDIAGALIYKLDRLARDLYIQEHLLRKLCDMDKTLISIKEPDIASNDPMRKAFRQFMGIVAELEKSFIAMRLSAGRKNKARKGRYAGGRPPIGFQASGKELSQDAERVGIIKTVYDMRHYMGLSLRVIAGRLNAEGIKTATGCQWYAGSIKYLLDNPIYSGNVHYAGVSAKNDNLKILEGA